MAKASLTSVWHSVPLLGNALPSPEMPWAKRKLVSTTVPTLWGTTYSCLCPGPWSGDETVLSHRVPSAHEVPKVDSAHPTCSLTLA